MPLPKYSREDWRIIRKQASELEDTLLWEAMQTLMTDAKSKRQKELESFISNDALMRYAQGAVVAHIHDIMVLEELRRRASRALEGRPRGQKEEEGP